VRRRRAVGRTHGPDPPGVRARTRRHRGRVVGPGRRHGHHQRHPSRGSGHRMSNTHHPVHTRWPGLIEAYRDRLPIGSDWEPVTLYEGGAPLIRATYLSEVTGCEVYLKVEGLSPTGSFKARGMAMAVTDAKARGQKAVLCASPG